jgi:Cu(I)/Ag(I) efflux system membrane fusion protein
MRIRLCTLVAVLTVGACGGGETAEEVAGGAEMDHSQHLMGGMGAATDSTGAVVRDVVRLTAEQERALGVTYAPVVREHLTRTIRTVGRIEAPETGIADITPKIDGFVEALEVSYTGEAVRRGQPLLRLYSPALVAAQEDLLTAHRMMTRIDSASGDAWENAQVMLRAARRRLEYWDIPAEQIAAVERSGEPQKTMTLVSPVSGIVLEKPVVEGQQVRAGERLYRIANLTEVWVEGDVFEQDLQFVQLGAQAHIEVSAYPGEHLMGRVSFVYPTVDEFTRTNRVRVTVRNADGRLKPGMFTTIYFDADIGHDVLTVGDEALVATGQRNLVFVRDADGAIQPREVVVGTRAAGRVQILSGLEEGEMVVASANFLVDAESRLGATGGSMPGMQHGEHGAAVEPDTEMSGHNHD